MPCVVARGRQIHYPISVRMDSAPLTSQQRTVSAVSSGCGRTGCAEKRGLSMAECEVLIVTANRQVREVLHQIFLGAGYTCQVASDGHEGLDVFKAWRTPLVLIELRMSGMTVIEFFRQVRSINADVAVILLADPSDVKTAI